MLPSFSFNSLASLSSVFFFFSCSDCDTHTHTETFRPAPRSKRDFFTNPEKKLEPSNTHNRTASRACVQTAGDPALAYHDIQSSELCPGVRLDDLLNS
jgi:hypothetical protein